MYPAFLPRLQFLSPTPNSASSDFEQSSFPGGFIFSTENLQLRWCIFIFTLTIQRPFQIPSKAAIRVSQKSLKQAYTHIVLISSSTLRCSFACVCPRKLGTKPLVLLEFVYSQALLFAVIPISYVPLVADVHPSLSYPTIVSN